ncbi:hypothetical protein COOONC_25143 [Cooperia oncophora]
MLPGKTTIECRTQDQDERAAPFQDPNDSGIRVKKKKKSLVARTQCVEDEQQENKKVQTKLAEAMKAQAKPSEERKVHTAQPPEAKKAQALKPPEEKKEKKPAKSSLPAEHSETGMLTNDGDNSGERKKSRSTAIRNRWNGYYWIRCRGSTTSGYESPLNLSVSS